MKLRYLQLCIVVGLLAACGGGGGEEVPEQPEVNTGLDTDNDGTPDVDDLDDDNDGVNDTEDPYPLDPERSRPPTNLLTINDFSYKGAFRLPVETYGVSSLDGSKGNFVYNSATNSIFIESNQNQDAIAEFAVPELVNSEDLLALNIADSPVQDFVSVLDRAPTGNPDKLDQLQGMAVIDGKLIVNAIKYYDGEGDNKDTTLVFEDASNLAGSAVSGFYQLQGAVHAAGWYAQIPAEWQIALAGTYMSGFASNAPINKRSSMGPSAFVVEHQQFAQSSDLSVATVPLMDYDLTNKLHEDNYNEEGQNDLWTEVSRAGVGFIIPNTATYAVFGSSGGHGEKGIGYKITQDDGNLCPGPCAFVADDYYNHYWLYDVNDMLKVKNGEMQPYEVRPYEYGQLEVPFQTNVRTGEDELHTINGGSYDAASNTLYLSLRKGDTEHEFKAPPVILAYSINSPTE